MERKNKLPKILIYGETFNSYTGGGITLKNLFYNWGKENLAVICEGPFSRHLNPSICDNYYQLGEEEIRWNFPFNKIRKKWNSGPVTIQNFEKTKSNNSKRAIRKIIVDDYFYPTLKYFGLYNSIIKVNLSQQAKNWITEFNPDIIYIQTGNYQDTLMTIEICQYFPQPKVVHIMDDWLTEVKTKGILKNYWYIKTEIEFTKLINSCNLLLGISDLMCKEYKSRYNKEFLTFHNPIDLTFWESETKINYSIENIVNILYAGRIGYGIESSLQEFAKGIKIYNEKNKIKIQLVLQTQHNPSWTSNYDFVKHKIQETYESLPKTFSSYDFLLMPIDFTNKGFDFLRLSMPTKASEYMISGTPIIIFSPKNTAIVNYAEENNWAYCITNNSPLSIEKSLIELTSNFNLRKALAEKAISTARINHDANKIRAEFRKIICSTLENEV